MYNVIFVTCKNKVQGKKIATALVKEKLAACVNIVGGVTSVYQWGKKLCADREVLLVIKSREELFSALERRVKSLHSYSVPEMISLPVLRGHEPYLEWVKGATTDA